MHMSEALQLFGAGREKRIYAVPPYTEVVSLDFEDHPFEIQTLRPSPARSAAPRTSISTRSSSTTSGGHMFVCSDTDHCEDRRAHGHRGELAGHPLEAAE